MMKKTKKLFAIVLCLTLAMCVTAGLVGCGGNGGKWITPELSPDEIVEPPAPDYKVYTVVMQYNGKNIDGGILSADISMGELDVTAKVSKDSQADGTVIFDSSDKTVATIDKNGHVTFLSTGETMLSVTAGDKSHRVVLVIGDDYAAEPSQHTVTVAGGRASKTSAAAGEYVTVFVETPAHKDFVNWNFPDSITWINGNVFKMPDEDVTIDATFTDMLYTLNVIGARVTQVNEDTEVEGEDNGFTNDGNTADYAVTAYHLPYEAEISVEAIDDPNGKIFVGWDYAVQDGRVGELGVRTHSFTMPDETLSVWAVFSPFTNRVITAGVNGLTSTKITDGIVSGGSTADEDLKGMCGYRLTIPAGATMSSDSYTKENVQGSVLNSIDTGTQLLKAIFKNNSDGDVAVEFYVSYYGVLVTTGSVHVAGGEVKTVFFTAGMGIHNPWMGFAVNENNSSSAVSLDMVVGMAPYYPKGDKSLSVIGGPEYVKFNKGEATVSDDTVYNDNGFVAVQNWGRDKAIANKVGTVYIANYAHGNCYSGSISANNPSYLSAKIANMPEYDSSDRTMTIYGKFINLAINDLHSKKVSVKLVISTSPTDPTNSRNKVAEYSIESNKTNDMQLFKLEFERKSSKLEYYFCLVKEGLDASGTLDANTFCVQMVYNNCIGYVEE